MLTVTEFKSESLLDIHNTFTSDLNNDVFNKLFNGALSGIIVDVKRTKAFKVFNYYSVVYQEDGTWKGKLIETKKEPLPF